jgi:polyhydroxyalkanoate synthase
MDAFAAPDHRASQPLDRTVHALAARFTGGLSPISLALAQVDWALHLWTQPAETARLAARAWQDAIRLAAPVAARADTATAAAPADERFAHRAWSSWPWSQTASAWQATEAWWDDAVARRGMTAHHAQLVRFHARQWLDMLAPSNMPLLNPEVIETTWRLGGANLVEGAQHGHEAWRRTHGLAPLQAPAAPLQPGVDLAITPGRVVHRNALVELIQYTPTTPTVHAEPVFIVPSWIMKYYILDLSPANSMVRWLVSQGHTVFILSWRNPDESDALVSFDDYLELGVFDPLAAIARLVPGEAVHAAGYCLGGTLLAIGAAALGRECAIAHVDALPRLASVSLLAAETDFTEPGELGVMIDESQVAMLEDLMAERGFLAGTQMAGSFTYLHSRELVWSRQLRTLWLGQSDAPNDLMAWNADVTRMPATMHSQYLRRLYLHNDLAEGRYEVEGAPVSLADIRQPMFAVGTEKDHVAPWRSVYKLHRLTDTDLTFALASGGHNAGIVSEPGHPHRTYAIAERVHEGHWRSPEEWLQHAVRHDGSWWPAWSAWLVAHGSGRRVAPRAPLVDEALGAAPGRHVRVRYED